MKSIPIVINNFNRLSTTKKLVEDLQHLGYNDIHILDNNSTYPPLLKWYSEIEKKVKVFRIGHNSGQLALWNTGYINQFKDYPYIVYTDSDIELNRRAISGFIEYLYYIACEYKVNKVGLALQIDDLPDTELGNRIKNHEAQFWANEIGSTKIYRADIDTTFAVIKPQLPFDYKAIRMGDNFTAKHIPWYTDWSNLSAEEQYVIDHLDNKHSTYKGYYLEWLARK